MVDREYADTKHRACERGSECTARCTEGCGDFKQKPDTDASGKPDFEKLLRDLVEAAKHLQLENHHGLCQTRESLSAACTCGRDEFLSTIAAARNGFIKSDRAKRTCGQCALFHTVSTFEPGKGECRPTIPEAAAKLLSGWIYKTAFASDRVATCPGFEKREAGK